MESGNIVEFIDRQKIICAVVLEVKKQRLRLLTETNREVNIASSRLSHKCNLRLEPSLGRDKIVEALKEISKRRQALIADIDIKELWEVLNTEQEWIDLDTMTAFCFPDSPTHDHESAVVRAFFENRLYFKFNQDSFFPNSEELVERKAIQEREAALRQRLVEEGSDLIKNALMGNPIDTLQDKSEIINILKSCYIFEKDSEYYSMGKAMLTGAGVASVETLFQALVKLGVFDENENIDLYRYKIPTVFSDKVKESASMVINSRSPVSADNRRKDLTSLSVMTIDGQGTLDFDDAISIEDHGDHYRLGVHIVDVGHYIKKGDVIDREALARGSSIYMPDLKIPMLPPGLAEDLCSLKADELRPAISVMVNLSRAYEIIEYEIFASIIKVKNQLTYYDVNVTAEEDADIITLRNIAESFRQLRLDGGAVQISLPDIHVWIDGDGEVSVSRINRESPGRMLVSELMIMANWLMARFLKKNEAPAIYRSQPTPKDRLFKRDGGTLFENFMQRRLLSRFVLNTQAEHHSGLGLNAYVTATSPIRKYFDLATQRQIRAVLGLEEPYTESDIEQIIQLLEEPMGAVSRTQYGRNRYWLLKNLEKRIGQKEEAIVLLKRRNNYQILLTEYMRECDLPMSSGIELKPEDLIRVTLQHVDARKNIVSVFMG
jgi:exoribonuclease-2